jgi:hypothetical protein
MDHSSDLLAFTAPPGGDPGCVTRNSDRDLSSVAYHSEFAAKDHLGERSHRSTPSFPCGFPVRGRSLIILARRVLQRSRSSRSIASPLSDAQPDDICSSLGPLGLVVCPKAHTGGEWSCRESERDASVNGRPPFGSRPLGRNANPSKEIPSLARAAAASGGALRPDIGVRSPISALIGSRAEITLGVAKYAGTGGSVLQKRQRRWVSRPNQCGNLPRHRLD